MKMMKNYFQFKNVSKFNFLQNNTCINYNYPSFTTIKSSQFNFSNINRSENNHMYVNKSSIYKLSSFGFASVKRYKPEKPGDSHKSQKGIYFFKRNTKGYDKSFSMKHTLRKFKVNSNRIQLNSSILNKKIYTYVSARALRTIKKYGGLDNYILKAPNKIINDSLFTKHLRDVLKNETINSCSEEAQYRTVQTSGIKNSTAKKRKAKYLKKQVIPSIYYPPEALKNDLSTFLYPTSKFITRLEQMEIDEISKEIEITTDYNKKNELTKKLLVLQKDDTDDHINDLVELQPIKNDLIRKHLKTLDIDAKIHYLELLKESEGFTQNSLKERYVHFSDNQPEIQLMLQELEIEKQNKSKTLLNKSVVENRIMDGSIFEGQLSTYDPYSEPQGREERYETNVKRKIKKVERKDNEILKKKKRYANDISMPDLSKIHYDN